MLLFSCNKSCATMPTVLVARVVSMNLLTFPDLFSYPIPCFWLFNWISTTVSFCVSVDRTISLWKYVFPCCGLPAICLWFVRLDLSRLRLWQFYSCLGCLFYCSNVRAYSVVVSIQFARVQLYCPEVSSFLIDMIYFLSGQPTWNILFLPLKQNPFSISVCL